MNIVMDKQITKLLCDAPQILASVRRKHGNAHRTAVGLVRSGSRSGGDGAANFKALYDRYSLKRQQLRDDVTHFPQVGGL